MSSDVSLQDAKQDGSPVECRGCRPVSGFRLSDSLSACVFSQTRLQSIQSVRSSPLDSMTFLYHQPESLIWRSMVPRSKSSRST